MRTITLYEVFDGTTYDNAAACMKYEIDQGYGEGKKGIHFYDSCEQDITSECFLDYDKLDNVERIVLDNPIAVEIVNSMFYVGDITQRGIETPGAYHFDYFDCGWIKEENEE